MKMNAEWYGLRLTSYNVSVNENGFTELTFDMKSELAMTDPKIEEFSRDISLLNAIRENNDPSVKDQFEQLLTTIALTNTRNVPEVRDSMIKTEQKTSNG